MEYWHVILSSIIITPSATVSYTVAGTDNNNCTNSVAVTVTVNSPPVVTVNSPTICSGQTANLNAGGANTYTWSTGSNSQLFLLRSQEFIRLPERIH